MNLRQHKRRHVRKLASRAPLMFPREGMRWVMPEGFIVQVSFAWQAAPVCLDIQAGKLLP